MIIEGELPQINEQEGLIDNQSRLTCKCPRGITPVIEDLSSTSLFDYRIYPEILDQRLKFTFENNGFLIEFSKM